MNRFDLVVLGAGSGGVRAARIAAGLGASVAVVEERFLGGTCVNVGCVPKKLLVYASHFAESFRDARGYGWEAVRPDFDWSTLIANKNREIERLNGVYRGLLEQSGVEIIHGRGVLLDPHTVVVGERRLQAHHVLIATGSRATRPALPGAEWALDSDAMFALPGLPQTAVVVGGGYIAVEFAGILAGLGVRTHLVHRGEQLLKRFDADIRNALQTELERKGIRLLLSRELREIRGETGAGCRAVVLSDGEVIDCDLVLSATGRRPNTDGLGLAAAGVETGERGEIRVDEDYRTSVPNIFAVGDVIDRVQLTPVALAEGMYVAQLLFGDNPVHVDYQHIPTAVFSQPSVATVGPTEEEARRLYRRIKVYRSSFRPMLNTLSGNPERTTIKLIVDAVMDRVVAAHMVGPEAAEIIQGLAVAIRAGASKRIFDTTLGIHPSTAEEFVTMRTPIA